MFSGADDSPVRPTYRAALALAAILVCSCHEPRGTGADRALGSVTAAPPAPPSASAPAPAPAAPTGPMEIRLAGRYAAQYFPAARPGNGVPLVVMLHGMCALPQYECPVFRRGTAELAGLFCPPGPVECRGGGAMWSGSDAALTRAVDAGIAALSAQASVDGGAARVLIGYSLGASAAARIVSAQPGRWTALMLVNAAPALGAAALGKAGVSRVALVAGDRDRTAPKLRKSAARLKRAGVEARFFELDETGHYFDRNTEQRLIPALGWLLQDPRPDAGEP